ncbi:heavy metal transport/detoxification superfamily protein [Striga asiatica]|uniref:Heavy metal transport/detoxification superfamily protein n=1 Tax=Striga asiatica TaxID=4170 RepID=A0A5A7QRY4_STRAF|nr:heavy metal transport/detoxification superfamily protein [Striga asiatica]
MKIIVVKLEFADEKINQKAMKTVSGLSGVQSITIGPKVKRLTVTGDVDPVDVVEKLRKLCHTDLVSVGPAKKPEKEKEKPKTEDEKKKNSPKLDPAQFLKAYQAHYQAPPQYYRQYQSYYKSVEEDPNGCAIC